MRGPRLIRSVNVALAVFAVMAAGLAAHATPMLSFLMHPQQGILLGVSVVAAAVGLLLFRRRGWALPLLLAPSVVALSSVGLGVWRERAVRAAAGLDPTLAARAADEARAAAARYGVIAVGAWLAASLLPIVALAIGRRVVSDEGETKGRERIALVVAAVVVVACAVWTWRRSSGTPHPEVVGFAAVPALLALVAILGGPARLADASGDAGRPARTDALASVLLSLGAVLVGLMPLYVLHAAFVRFEEAETLAKWTTINRELDQGMVHAFRVGLAYVGAVLVLGVTVARRRAGYRRALAHGAASFIPFGVACFGWAGFGFAMDRVEHTSLSYKPVDATKLAAFEPGYDCDELKETELFFLGRERLHRGTADIGPASALDDLHGCVEVVSAAQPSYVAVDEGASFRRLGCLMRAMWVVRHSGTAYGQHISQTCGFRMVAERADGRSQCTWARFPSCAADGPVLEVWLKGDGHRFYRWKGGAGASGPLGDDVDLTSWARDQWSEHGKHTAYDERFWDVAVVRGDAKTPLHEIVVAQKALASVQTPPTADGLSRPAYSVGYGFIEPWAEDRYDSRSGSSTACPRPLGDYCRACSGFATRAKAPHASRIEQATRVGLGTCGKYRVFAEQDGLFDGRGVVEYFDAAAELIGASDDRDPIACAKFGEVPACDPQIVWSSPGEPRPPEWPANVPTPHVRLAQHSAPGGPAEGLEIADIGRRKLLRCYRAALDMDPEAHGRISLSFFISPDGTIRDVREQSTTLSDETMRECVVKSFSGKLGAYDKDMPATCTFDFAMGRDDWE